MYVYLILIKSLVYGINIYKARVCLDKIELIECIELNIAVLNFVDNTF